MSGRPKNAVFRLPGGGGRALRLVSFNKTMALQPSCGNFSLGKSSLWGLIWTCFFFISLLTYCRVQFWLKVAASPTTAAKLRTRPAVGEPPSRNFCAPARWVLGSMGPCPEQTQHQRCSGAFSRLPKETADPYLHWRKLLAHMLNLSVPATQRWLSLGQTKLEAPSLQKSHPSLDCLHTNSPPGVSGPRSAADFWGWWGAVGVRKAFALNEWFSDYLW